LTTFCFGCKKSEGFEPSQSSTSVNEARFFGQRGTVRLKIACAVTTEKKRRFLSENTSFLSLFSTFLQIGVWQVFDN